MVNLLIFECVDVAVTLTAACVLVRMVVARPALAWSAPVEEEPVAIDLPVEADPEPEAVDDGISWPVSGWSRVAA